MTLVEKARALAQTINQATEHPWCAGFDYISEAGASRFTGEILSDGLHVPRTDEDIYAVVAARNDAPEILTQLANRVDELTGVISDAIDRLQHRRVADYYPEGANNAAQQMSEDMRLLANSLIDALGEVE